MESAGPIFLIVSKDITPGTKCYLASFQMLPNQLFEYVEERSKAHEFRSKKAVEIMKELINQIGPEYTVQVEQERLCAA